MEFSEDLYFAANALTRLLSARADQAFKAFGFSTSHAYLLMLVNARPGIQPTQLSQKLQLTPSTITRLIEKMEYQGYLQRKSVGRATHVEATAKGEGIDEKLRMVRQQLMETYSEILGGRYTKVLTEMTDNAAQLIKESE